MNLSQRTAAVDALLAARPGAVADPASAPSEKAFVAVEHHDRASPFGKFPQTPEKSAICLFVQ